MTLAVETQVSDGVITSSPGPMPSASRVTCRAPVAEDSATAWRQPRRSAKRCSSSWFFGPVVIQPERRTCSTAAISSSPMLGRENGRKSSDMYEASVLGGRYEEVIYMSLNAA